ncbi:metalloregulator ArsR/SmtB family transcription factor [Acidihalobacter prosperus]
MSSTAPEQVFRALSDQTRLRCLILLQGAGELCVCELSEALDISQPKISRHLANLRETGMVRDRRDKLWVFYRISENLPGWVRAIIDVSAESLREQEPFSRDRTCLQIMATRDRNGCVASD